MSTAGPGVAEPAARALRPPALLDVAVASAVAAAVLAGTSTGSVVVAAVLIGVATLDRWSAAAAVLAALAASVRFGTASFDDLAGIQSVLGLAGSVGPATAAASAWSAAGAVLLSTRPPAAAGGGRGLARHLPAVATGLLAAALVAGPGPSDLAVRSLASLVGVVVAVGVGLVADRPVLRRVRPMLAVGLALVAVVLAAWPG